MAEKEALQKVVDCIVGLKFDQVQEACQQVLDAGIPAFKIVDEGMAEGMRIVGEKYEANEYFLSELIVAGEVMKEGMKVLEPHLKSGQVRKIGKIVIGTVYGDLHEIGKNVVSVMLGAAGFDIVDLGVDAPVEKFVEAVKKEKPEIVGMSALITVTMPEMEKVVKALEEAGLRHGVKVIIGGAPVTSQFAEKIHADAAAKDAIDGVKICKSWVQA
ncbi:MAG: corrinoid protein [Aigarchaeota archaeon]|nr:corrinoid protein [Aigarchaeota archaeon]